MAIQPYSLSDENTRDSLQQPWDLERQIRAFTEQHAGAEGGDSDQLHKSYPHN
jgi:hypothetical protein